MRQYDKLIMYQISRGRIDESLEYIIVHELMHLLESGHNARFHSLMDTFLPDWRERKYRLDHFN